MPFINFPMPKAHQKQMSIWDILMNVPQSSREYITDPESNTITKYVETIPEKELARFNIQAIINDLAYFNKKYERLFQIPLKQQYTYFYIPKKSKNPDGSPKFRKICAPNDGLSEALTELKRLLENQNCAMYHTSAFAYIRKRCPADVSKKHQHNNSHWWLLTDFHDFFGSITYDWTLNTLGHIFPYSEVLKREDGKREFSKALSLCFLDNGLPQGTPISPMLTNLVMIPFDYIMSKELKGNYVYTRYADDIQISSRVKFDKAQVINLIKSTLNRLKAPFNIAPEKTKFLTGSVFILGVMYNENGERTVGHKNKKQFRATLFNYLCDKVSGVQWDKERLMQLMGKYSYYSSIEKECFENIFKDYSKRFQFDCMTTLKEDLRTV